LALRSEVFPPNLIGRIAAKLDGSGYSSVWFPDVGAYDAMELASLTLGATNRIHVGTGVVRLLEHDPTIFVRRLGAINGFAPDRFILGVGTGSRAGTHAIRELVERVEYIRKGLPPPLVPKLFFSALRRKMFEASVGKADGVLLNFCSADYVRQLISASHKELPKGFVVAGYVKVFFAEEEKVAMDNMLNEFVKYNEYPNYRRLFMDMGVNETLEELRGRGIARTEVMKELYQISLHNPDSDRLIALLRTLGQAGLGLPIVYPYVVGNDDYKLEVIQRLIELSKSF
jgi:hypothetical protein